MNNQPSAEDQVKNVLEEIEARCSSDGDFPYLLLDGARLLKAAPGIKPVLELSQGVSLVGVDATHAAHAAGPLLFEMKLSEWKAARRCKHLTALFNAHICSVVIAQQPLLGLSEHLSQHVDVVLSDGAQMLMRFFDPRVLPFWFEVLPPSHRSALASKVSAWGHIDRCQQLSWLSLREPQVDVGEPQYPLVLSAKQDEFLMRRCLTYALLDKLLEDPESRLGEVPAGLRYEQLDALISKAHSHGFDGMADMEDICRLGLQYGFDFDERPPMKRALGQNRPTEHVHAILARFSETDWKGMQA